MIKLLGPVIVIIVIIVAVVVVGVYCDADCRELINEILEQLYPLTSPYNH